MIKTHKRFIYRVFIFIISSVLVFSSCTKEDEAPSDTTVITGEWRCSDDVSENGIYDAQSYTIDLSKNSDNYIITNYANLGIDTVVTAQISGYTISVSEQTIGDIVTHGTGTFTNNSKTVNFTYYLDNEKIESVWNRN